MRRFRTQIEHHYCEFVVEFVSRAFSSPASLSDKVTDRPDALVHVAGKRIGVELSRMPSDYVIRHLVRKMPPMSSSPEVIGELFVHPFEAHRRVYEVASKKSKSVRAYRKSARADEVWLAIHSHSLSDPWPMSKFTSENSRIFEKRLMRFGVSKLSEAFDRILFIYPEGEVVELAGPKVESPVAIMLDSAIGYPAAIEYRFNVGFQAPPPGLGERIADYPNISFKKYVTKPKDEWMNLREPDLCPSEIGAQIIVGHGKSSFLLIENGVKVAAFDSTYTYDQPDTYGLAAIYRKPIRDIEYKFKC